MWGDAARHGGGQGDEVEVWDDDVWGGGVHQVDPSDDESIPVESQEAPLSLPTYFSRPLSSLDPRVTIQCEKRPRHTLESGPAKKPRTGRGNLRQDVNLGSTMDPRRECGRQQNVNMENYGVFPSYDDHIRLALAPHDVQNATYLSTAGWPPY